ncbi:DUF6482 family protein [Marinospirillum alkaliphilum]|uniref:Uncharacterized protein n=1 Tax=Marinospirillum alkaliphilum DSM 21637 TaxID=1122209 RepID=A0A1K1ZGB7_9GAMM|nr:DUF6482 family protein [Marinospirillum alkaliphilum]SFX73158.1 hypothetical protein SAMN02745752_02680 [Marinospirillum alkaliphilum DSM 21637]
MQIKELKRLLSEHPNTEIRIISHAGSRFYLIQIRQEQELDLLKGWRGQPRVFRSLDEATGELKRHGIDRAVLLHHVANDEVIGRDAAQLQLNGYSLPLCL